MIPAVLTAPVAAVPAAVLLRHHPGAAHQVAADQVLPEVAVQALPGVLQAGAAAPQVVLPAVPQVPMARTCQVAAVSSVYQTAVWFCIRSAVAKMTEMMMTLQTMMILRMMILRMMILRMMILQVPTVLTVVLLQTAVVSAAVLPEVTAQAPPGVLQAEAAVLAVPVAPAAPVAVLQVLHLLRNQVHRMMIPQAPVIREMMTEMN